MSGRTVGNASGKLPIAIMIAVLLLLCLGAGAFTFSRMGQKLKIGGSSEEAEKSPKLLMWELDEFVVNLADKYQPRYLKVTISLEVESNDPRSGGRGDDEREAEDVKVRDAIISVLTGKHFADLVALGGKDELKAKLKSEINSVLEDGKVVNIYFTAFAMQ